MKKRALIATIETTEKLSSLACLFVKHGWELIATSKAYDFLKSNSIAVINVADFVGIEIDYGFPPTLHPKIEYALTEESAENRIDLVFDTPYTLDKGFDIGGHTLLALSIKGDRIPVINFTNLEEIIIQIELTGEIQKDLINKLQRLALRNIVNRYIEIAGVVDAEAKYQQFEKVRDLINGENPYQKATLFKDMSGCELYSLLTSDQIFGEIPCYTNLADADYLLTTMNKASNALFKYYGKVPYIAIAAKHGNPCGMALSWGSQIEAIEKALWGNPVAIWGGEFICNFMIAKEEANLLQQSSKKKGKFGDGNWMLDVILSPEMDNEAVDILGQRAKTKIFINKNLYNLEYAFGHDEYKSIKGGCLIQEPNNYVLSIKDLNWHRMDYDRESVSSCVIAWSVAYSSFHGGNEVALAKDDCLISVGGGPSTVEAAEIAVWKAQKYGKSTRGAIFCTDAFFPYVDAPQVLIDAGCKGGVVPAGGTRFTEVADLFYRNNVIVGFIPEIFRGFCRH
ncbi:MAG: hypothetical protein WC589_22130 [Sphingobacterium sp.]